MENSELVTLVQTIEKLLCSTGATRGDALGVAGAVLGRAIQGVSESAVLDGFQRMANLAFDYKDALEQRDAKAAASTAYAELIANAKAAASTTPQPPSTQG